MGNNETENNSRTKDNDIVAKLKDLYISEVTEKYAKLEHDTIERFKHMTVNDVEDIDDDLVESLKNVLRISGNKETNKTASHVSNYEFQKYLITVLLMKCEFSVTWNPIKSPPYDMPQLFMDKVIDKEEEIVDTRQFKWDNFVLQLILIHELSNEKKFSEALAKLRDLKHIFSVLREEDCKEPFFLAYYEAQRHVITSTEAYVLLKMNLLLEAKKVLKNIVPVSNMTKQQRSCILGIKASMFMEYGFQSSKKCIEIIKEAIEFDEFQAQWHYILGKAMGRIRRFNCYKSVDKEEITALEKALELETNPSYIVHLAQTYREHAYIVFLNSRDKRNTSVYTNQMSELIAASKKLMRKALEMSPSCPHVNIRCALGLLKLPFVFRININKTVQRCIDVAHLRAPNNRMLHHIIGIYYTKVDEDSEKAEKHLEIAAHQNTYGASIDLIKFKYRQNKEFDILKSLQTLLVQYNELERKCQTLAQIGSYYLFKERDLLTAVEYYMKIIDMYPQCETMKMHKVLFLRMSFPTNLYIVVNTEINLQLSQESATSSNKLLRRFVVKGMMIDPDAIKESEKHKSSLVEEILKESEKSEEIVAAAEKLKNLTRERIEEHLGKTKNKQTSFKPRRQIKCSEAKADDKGETDENNKNESNKIKENKQNKKAVKKKSNRQKGLKRSHSTGSIPNGYQKDQVVPKFVWDICVDVRSADENQKKKQKWVTNNNSGDPKNNSGKQNPKVSCDKVNSKERWNPRGKRRNSDSSVHLRSNETFCSNTRGECNSRVKRGDMQDSSSNIIRSVSVDMQLNSGETFGKPFGARNFNSTSSLKQSGGYRKRSESTNSEDSEFSYGAVSALKLKQHQCMMKKSTAESQVLKHASYHVDTKRNTSVEHTMPWNDGCQGNSSRGSSVDRSALGSDFTSDKSSNSKGFPWDGKPVRGRGRGRGRGQGNVDKFKTTGPSESLESLTSKIKHSNSFLPCFVQNKET